jgi:hypothetical protein
MLSLLFKVFLDFTKTTLGILFVLLAASIIVFIASYPIGILITTFVPKQWLILIFNESVLNDTFLNQTVVGMMFLVAVLLVFIILIYPICVLIKTIKKYWEEAKLMLEISSLNEVTNFINEPIDSNVGRGKLKPAPNNQERRLSRTTPTPS